MSFVSDNLLLILGLVGFLVLMGIAGLVAGLLSRTGSKVEPATSLYQKEDYPYEQEDCLLTPAERTFYSSLYEAVSTDQQIFSKVRLIDLVKVRPGTANSQGYKNRIDRKHVDFVVCDRDTSRPLLVVELDDSSHQRARSQESDTVKDRVLEAAGLPILRVPAKGSYEPKGLAHAIRNKLVG